MSFETDEDSSLQASSFLLASRRYSSIGSRRDHPGQSAFVEKRIAVSY
jgi:hypothetical protein